MSEQGREQAAAVGETIRSAGWAVDQVLCSPAVRVRETVDGLELPEDVEVEVVDSLYDAGSDGIIELIQALPDHVRCALVVGHAPGVPGVLHELVDPSTADPRNVVGRRDRAIRPRRWPLSRCLTGRSGSALGSSQPCTRAERALIGVFAAALIAIETPRTRQ